MKDVMSKIRRDQIDLMRKLRKVISECIDNASVNPEIEEDVSEFLTEVVDKRRHRKLKQLKNELDEFITEMVNYRAVQNLQKALQKHDEEQRIEIARIHSERTNEHQ